MSFYELSDRIRNLRSLAYEAEGPSYGVPFHNNMAFTYECDYESGDEAPILSNYRGGIKVNGLLVFDGYWKIEGPWQKHVDASIKFLEDHYKEIIQDKTLKEKQRILDEENRKKRLLEEEIAKAKALFE